MPGRDRTSEEEETRKNVRIVFMGTPSFAATILRGILEDGWNVVATVTQPDRPRGRGKRVTPPPVKELAQGFSVPVFQPKSLRDTNVRKTLKDLDPNVILTAAYGRILPTKILNLPPMGCFNVHFSLLPAYRGPAPVAWAVMNGERKTGITIFRMDKGIDTGEMIAARAVEIGRSETAGELTERLAEVAVDLVPSVLWDVILGKATYTKQDPMHAIEAPMLTKADGLVDWTLTAVRIADRIRGLNPWPGAFTFWQEKRIKLWSARAEHKPSSGRPGEVLAVSPKGIEVGTGEGVLCVLSLQMEGRKRTEVSDFLRGHAMKAGDRFDKGS